MTNYYVYYKVTGHDLKGLGLSIQLLFEKINNKTGIQGKWLHRRDDPATYMEVYEDVADEAVFEALLEQETKGLGLERRTERFVCA